MVQDRAGAQFVLSRDDRIPQGKEMEQAPSTSTLPQASTSTLPPVIRLPGREQQLQSEAQQATSRLPASQHQEAERSPSPTSTTAPPSPKTVRRPEWDAQLQSRPQPAQVQAQLQPPATFPDMIRQISPAHLSLVASTSPEVIQTPVTKARVITMTPMSAPVLRHTGLLSQPISPTQSHKLPSSAATLASSMCLATGGISGTSPAVEVGSGREAVDMTAFTAQGSSPGVKARAAVPAQSAEVIKLASDDEAAQLQGEMKVKRKTNEEEARMQASLEAKGKAEERKLGGHQRSTSGAKRRPEEQRPQPELESKQKTEVVVRGQARIEVRPMAEEMPRVEDEVRPHTQGASEELAAKLDKMNEKIEQEARKQAELEAKREIEEMARVQAELEEERKAVKVRVQAELEAQRKTGEEVPLSPRLQAELNLVRKTEGAKAQAELEANRNLEKEADSKLVEARKREATFVRAQTEMKATWNQMRETADAEQVQTDLEAMRKAVQLVQVDAELEKVVQVQAGFEAAYTADDTRVPPEMMQRSNARHVPLQHFDLEKMDEVQVELEATHERHDARVQAEIETARKAEKLVQVQAELEKIVQAQADLETKHKADEARAQAELEANRHAEKLVKVKLDLEKMSKAQAGLEATRKAEEARMHEALEAKRKAEEMAIVQAELAAKRNFEDAQVPTQLQAQRITEQTIQVKADMEAKRRAHDARVQAKFEAERNSQCRHDETRVWVPVAMSNNLKADALSMPSTDQSLQPATEFLLPSSVLVAVEPVSPPTTSTHLCSSSFSPQALQPSNTTLKQEEQTHAKLVPRVALPHGPAEQTVIYTHRNGPEQHVIFSHRDHHTNYPSRTPNETIQDATFEHHLIGSERPSVEHHQICSERPSIEGIDAAQDHIRMFDAASTISCPPTEVHNGVLEVADDKSPFLWIGRSDADIALEIAALLSNRLTLARECNELFYGCLMEVSGGDIEFATMSPGHLHKVTQRLIHHLGSRDVSVLERIRLMYRSAFKEHHSIQAGLSCTEFREYVAAVLAVILQELEARQQEPLTSIQHWELDQTRSTLDYLNSTQAHWSVNEYSPTGGANEASRCMAQTVKDDRNSQPLQSILQTIRERLTLPVGMPYSVASGYSGSNPPSRSTTSKHSGQISPKTQEMKDAAKESERKAEFLFEQTMRQAWEVLNTDQQFDLVAIEDQLREEEARLSVTYRRQRAELRNKQQQEVARMLHPTAPANRQTLSTPPAATIQEVPGFSGTLRSSEDGLKERSTAPPVVSARPATTAPVTTSVATSLPAFVAWQL